ncbi:lipid-A-disaccharide synthase [Campylobacterota bacterium]|nr:lipid-A-disaccharide synthase [Campylobacterota bacterium]
MNILVSALEPSANVHLGLLLADLKAANLKAANVRGIFDRKFGTPIVESSEFSAMGIIDVLSKISLAKKAMNLMADEAQNCDVALLIDSPAFNIPLAKKLKKSVPNLKIIYYILPKVWAWKSGRVKVVEKYTDIQAAIFPFEKLWWQKGVFVGNPLLREIEAFRNEPAIKENYVFLPGSRRTEIARLFPIFKQTAAKLNGKKIVVIPSHFDDKTIADLYGDLSEFSIERSAANALQNAKFSFVCSGTATLEAALIGSPFVLAYKANAIDFFIGRRIVKLPFVGLANIIFDFAGLPPMHDELLQNNCTAENLLKCADRADPAQFLSRSIELRKMLNGCDRPLSEIVENL